MRALVSPYEFPVSGRVETILNLDLHVIVFYISLSSRYGVDFKPCRSKYLQETSSHC